MLVPSDRDTALCLALPTLQKGGRSLITIWSLRCSVSLCIVVTLKFVCVVIDEETKYSSSRGSCQASMRLLENPGSCRACSNRRSSGQWSCCLRSKANLLVSQIEAATGCKGPVFGCMHPVYAWALVHSAQSFSVKRAMTSYERTTGRFYSGKVAMYGETVLGY